MFLSVLLFNVEIVIGIFWIDLECFVVVILMVLIDVLVLGVWVRVCWVVSVVMMV